MFTDILIGLIIGIGLERATKISYALQKMIKQAKEARKKELARKSALVSSETKGDK